MEPKENLFQPPEYPAEMFSEYIESAKARALRASEIEAILGDEYDLDRLRELVEADRDQEFQRHLKRFDNVLPKKPHWIEQMDRDAIQRWLTRSLTTNGISEDRLRKICEADREGRCVVLPPLKIGDTAYFVLQNQIYSGKIYYLRWERHEGHGDYGLISASGICGTYSAGLKEFGKTVFATCEAAEAALKKAQHGKDL